MANTPSWLIVIFPLTAIDSRESRPIENRPPSIEMAPMFITCDEVVPVVLPPVVVPPLVVIVVVPLFVVIVVVPADVADDGVCDPAPCVMELISPAIATFPVGPRSMLEMLSEPTLPPMSTWALGPIVAISSVLSELVRGVIRPVSSVVVATSPPSCPDRILKLRIARSWLASWYLGWVSVMVIVLAPVVP